MAKAERSKPKEDLIPKSIGAAWRRASKARFRTAAPTDLRAIFDWIVSIMTPAARGTLMSDLVKQGARAASARQEQRQGVQASARPGRRKGLKSAGPRQRRKSVRAAARPGRRKGLQSLGPRQRRKGVREPARQERRRGKRSG
jgi:hypothetical protein